MLKRFDLVRDETLEDWYLSLPPAQITIHNLKTGQQIQESSLAAVSCRQEKIPERDLETGETRALQTIVPDRLIAVGRAALEYKAAPDTVVFSPFRGGQIAHYQIAQQLVRALLKQAGLKLTIPKPVMCIHIQAQTTQVEKQALSEAAIQAGAQKVFLYDDPLSVMLDRAAQIKALRGAVIVHIDPQG